MNSMMTASTSPLREEAGDVGPPHVFRKHPHLKSGFGLLANIVEEYVWFFAVWHVRSSYWSCRECLRSCALGADNDVISYRIFIAPSWCKGLVSVFYHHFPAEVVLKGRLNPPCPQGWWYSKDGHALVHIASASVLHTAHQQFRYCSALSLVLEVVYWRLRRLCWSCCYD